VQLLTPLSTSRLRVRAALLQLFNARLARVLQFIDVGGDEGDADADRGVTWSIGAKLRRIGHCVFTSSKLELVQAAVAATVSPIEERPPEQRFHRGRALLAKERGQASVHNSACLFSQAFSQLNGLPARRLRAPLDPQRALLWPTKFVVYGPRGDDVDEEGRDWGGLYAECVNTIVSDLFDPRCLDLCIAVPNSHGGGEFGNNVCVCVCWGGGGGGSWCCFCCCCFCACARVASSQVVTPRPVLAFHAG
jgi:hypothetical protein